jgi:glutathione S-transferase
MTSSAARLILYNLDHSPFAARVRIAIRRKRLDVALLAPPGGVRSEAYRRINPLGLVPALLTEDGAVLPECDVIVDYLDARFPEPRLLPQEPGARARCRLLSRIADLYLAPALKELFERTKTSAGAADTAALLAAVRHPLAVLDGLLQGGAYAVGDRLSAADCALAPLLFFVERCAPLAPDSSLMDEAKTAAYWAGIIQHSDVAPVLAEMAAAQVRRAAARARGEPED